MKLTAYMNHGRWLVACPKHSFGNKAQVTPEILSKGWVAPCCYPDIIAVFPAMEGNRFVMKPDRSRQHTARFMAEQNNDVYEVALPDEYKEIEKIMENRQKENRNFLAGETLESILQEVSNGLDNPV